MLFFFKLLVTLTGALFGLGLILVGSKILENKASLRRFKKLTKGLPIYWDHRLLGNHISSVPFKRRNCHALLEEHEKHGPNIGGLLGDKFAMSTLDLDLIKRIVIDEGHLHLDRVSLHLPMREYEESLLLAPGDQWKPIRRVFAPALKSNKFKAPNVIHEIEQSIGKLIGHIERELNRNKCSFDADEFSHKYSLDLVFSCFYKQYKLVDFDDPSDMWTGLIDSLLTDIQNSPFIRLSMIFPWFRHVVDWAMWHFHRQGFGRKQLLDFIRRQTEIGMQARRQLQEAGTSIKDSSNFTLKDGTKFSRNIIDTVIDGYLDGKLTTSQYMNSSFFLLLAADKTVADCIVHTLYLLSIHQDVQARLREAIKMNGADSEYLTWVLNESLRLLPPAPIGCSRTISHEIDLTEQHGYVIPARTFVITNSYAIHRLKEYWGDDAEEFRPERWRDTSSHHPMQFLAFGAGKRTCPGREFALFHMKMLFVALLSRYKFEGEPRDDAYKFDSPCFIFVIPNSLTFVKISRLVER